MIEMTQGQMSDVQGGSWTCFFAGVLTVGGIATLQPEIAAAGLFVASQSC
jgi:hypothetical protein